MTFPKGMRSSLQRMRSSLRAMMEVKMRDKGGINFPYYMCLVALATSFLLNKSSGDSGKMYSYSFGMANSSFSADSVRILTRVGL